MLGFQTFVALIASSIAMNSKIYNPHWLDVSSSTVVSSPSVADRHQCAQSCLVSYEWCEGFSYRLQDSVEVCDLYSSILDTGSGTDNGYIWSRDTPISILSTGKPSSQSSIHSGKEADRGNNGIKPVAGGNGGDYFGTNSENSPWWRVDLEAVYSVKRVYFMNIGNWNCCWERANNMVAIVSVNEADIDRTDMNSRCGDKIVVAAQFDNWFYCSPALDGQFVQLQLDGVTNFLNLYEIEVYGSL